MVAVVIVVVAPDSRRTKPDPRRCSLPYHTEIKGKKRLDHVRHVDIKEAHMYPRLRWFGHVQRRDKGETTRTILHYDNRWNARLIEADQR